MYLTKKKIKNTELEVTPILFGTGNFKDKIDKIKAFELLDTYTETGGNFIDTANVYCRWLPDTKNSSEQWMGEWLKSRGGRDNLVIATKGGHPNIETWENTVNKDNLTKELDESLRTLGLDYVDFYWFHRDNEEMPMEELIAIGEDFVREGKIRYYGASNFKFERMRQAWEISERTGKGFRALSNQWSLAYPNQGYKLGGDMTLENVDRQYYKWFCETGFTLIPYSATAMGFFGKVANNKLNETVLNAYGNERNFKLAKFLGELSKKYGVSEMILSVAILLNQNFDVFPVAAYSNKEQLLEVLSSIDVKINKEDMEIIKGYFY